MQHRGFHRGQDQVQGQALVPGLKMVASAGKLRLPVVDPDLELPFFRPGQPQGPPAGLFPKPEGAPGGIGEGQVGEIDGVGPPGRAGLRVRRAQGRPEEGELVAEGSPSPDLQMARIIPPLRLVLRVGAVVPGKLEDPAGPGPSKPPPARPRRPEAPPG